MTKRTKAVLPLAVLLTISWINAQAGGSAYFGMETSDDDNTLNFIGASMGDKLHVNIFAANLKYTYDDNNDSVDVTTNFITPSIGYRFGTTFSYSVALGATYSDEDQDRSTSKTSDTDTGGFVQAGISYWKPDRNYELLASYTAPTEFVWSRARAKHLVAYIHDEIFLGGELFWMGNDDFDSTGAGVFAEARGDVLGILVKAGLKNSSDNDSSVYGGVEFGLSF